VYVRHLKEYLLLKFSLVSKARKNPGFPGFLHFVNSKPGF